MKNVITFVALAFSVAAFVLSVQTSNRVDDQVTSEAPSIDVGLVQEVYYPDLGWRTALRIKSYHSGGFVVHTFSTPFEMVSVGAPDVIELDRVGFVIVDKTTREGLTEVGLYTAESGQIDRFDFSHLLQPGDAVLAWVTVGFVPSESLPMPISPVEDAQAVYWNPETGFAVAVSHIDGTQE